MKKFIIVGKKWHDDVNGNTYHSVQVIDTTTNKLINKPQLTYGYDDQWKQTAYDDLKKLGKVDEKDRFNHELNRKRFIFIDAGFHKKKDLLRDMI